MKEQDYLNFVPKKIDKKIKKFVDEIVFANSKYVFVRKEDGRQIGHCTSCNKEYPEYGKHNDYKECPMCGERVQIKLTRYKRSSLIDCRTLIIFQRGLRGFNGIVGRGFYVERDYSEDYTKVKTRYKEIALYIFGEKKSVLHHRSMRNYTYGFDDFSKERRKSFYRTSSIFNFNINGLANPPFYIDRDSLDRAVEGTDYKYIIHKNMKDENLLKYLNLYTRYPIIESMQKIGLESIVDYAVRGISLQRQVNLRGKNVFAVMKLNRGELKEMLNSEVRVTPELLKLYRKNKTCKYKLTIKELKDIE
ncbi:MAG: hypothetical protein ACRCVJ_12310 [Clostridium sp.]|uniref:hypothetical protein n=1 Tax=Clostridium sp. TaxID=1506 RepID=UPI003F38B2EE